MRNFVNVTWNNSAENYDGSQQQNRHWNPNGSAAIHNYSDEALAKDKPKKSPITIQDRILPQAARVNKLTEQLKELVVEYKKGNIFKLGVDTTLTTGYDYHIKANQRSKQHENFSRS